MKTLPFFLAISMTLAGCQTSHVSSDDTLTSASLSSAAASAIAGDLSARLAEHARPKGTTIRLQGDRTDFAIALEAALKGWGYIVNPEKLAADATALDYSLEQSGENILASIAMPSVALSRTYLASAEGATPKSPLSVMQRD